jgi:rhodanese-related sulfurtransferase
MLRPILAAGLWAWLLLSCSPAAQTNRQLSTAELESLLEQGDVFFLDVREPSEVQASGSVRGYVNIPLGQLPTRMAEIPRDKLIVTL